MSGVGSSSQTSWGTASEAVSGLGSGSFGSETGSGESSFGSCAGSSVSGGRYMIFLVSKWSPGEAPQEFFLQEVQGRSRLSASGDIDWENEVQKYLFFQKSCVSGREYRQILRHLCYFLSDKRQRVLQYLRKIQGIRALSCKKQVCSCFVSFKKPVLRIF